MIRLACLLVLTAGFQVITSQEQQVPPHGPPPGWANNKCAGPPPGVKHPQNCCKAEPMYTEEEMTECGFEKIDDENRQGPPRPPDCNKQECLLKKRNLLNDDNSINYDAAKDYMKTWVEVNPEFQAAADAAAAVCMGEGGPPGPPKICEANRLMFCVGAVIFSNCPTWQDTDDCKRLQEHMNECRPKFPPPN